MAYQLTILPTAEADLEALDAEVRARALRRIVWLREHAAEIIHHPLSNLPDDLAGLCRLRSGDWRILYWVYPDPGLVKVYRVQHRSEVYRDF